MARSFIEKSLGQSLLGEKVIRRGGENKRKEREEKKNLVATSFATQPVYNAGRAAHALHSDQNGAEEDGDMRHICGADDEHGYHSKSTNISLVFALPLGPQRQEHLKY
jgi:hypothetical protein